MSATTTPPSAGETDRDTRPGPPAQLQHIANPDLEVTNLKGVILAGGTGSRLLPLTTITNKHLLPVYDKPMIFYPIEALVKAGVTEIMVVTGGNHAGEFLRLLKSGKELGCTTLQYAYQEHAGGIAEALGLAQEFIDSGKCIVVLGDNVLEYSIAPYVENFRRQERGSRILLKEVSKPESYGVPI